MKVAFIIPKDDDRHSPLSQFAQCKIFPPVGLARMAGFVGKKGDVSLVDERLVETQHTKSPDVTVIFINSYNHRRAYLLADQYRNHGSHVVLTGPMLNHLPEEAYHHADSLFVGSGEDCMATFLLDYQLGETKSVYGIGNLNTADSQYAFPRRTVNEMNVGNTALRLA